MPNESNYERLLAKQRMTATDRLSPEKWLAYAERLSVEQLQCELLRQATDTKLQLISILNALHFILIAICLLSGVAIWRIW